MSEWQIIETVPKGKDVLICVSGRTESAWIVRVSGTRKNIYFFKGSSRRCTMMPTHWMPIPEPPK